MLLFDGKRAAPFATLGMLLLLATFSTASTEDLGDNVLMPVDLEKTSFDTVLQVCSSMHDPICTVSYVLVLVGHSLIRELLRASHGIYLSVFSDEASAMQALPAGRGVLMEFYASWCPACKHFQPHYEKVAAFFYGTPRPKPDVYVARVDCATQVTHCPATHYCVTICSLFAESRAMHMGQRHASYETISLPLPCIKIASGQPVNQLKCI